MNQKDRYIQEQQEIIRTLMRDAKQVYCPICSTPDWEVWHEPMKCPTLNTADTCSDIVKRSEKINKRNK